MDVVNVLARKQDKPGGWLSAMPLLAPLAMGALHASCLYKDKGRSSEAAWTSQRMCGRTRSLLLRGGS
jgi:hypothetical protein